MSDRPRRVMRQTLRKEKQAFLSPPVGAAWIWLTRDMLESPAYRALSRAGHQLLARLMVEHCNHAGKENGRLAVSWDAFQAASLHRSTIAQTLDEVTRLGFVRVVDEGHKAYGSALGRRATYRLTFAGVVGDDSGLPTNDWEAISKADARSIMEAVREAERRRKAKRRTGCSPDIERGTEYRTGPKVRNSVLGESIS